MPISKATASSVAPAAKGDLVVGSATNDAAVLGVGSNDQVLTADSSTATGLKWATPSAGGMTLIQETVANANSSISFTSIPSTYKSLLLVWTGIKHSAADGTFDIRFNNSSSTIYGGTFWGTGSTDSTFTTTIADGKTRVGGDSWGFFGQAVPSGVSLLGSAQGQLYVDNYASTTKFKPYYAITSHYNDIASTYRGTKTWGNFSSTSAITSIDIVRINGTQTMSNLSNTSIRLYGLS